MWEFEIDAKEQYVIVVEVHCSMFSKWIWTTGDCNLVYGFSRIKMIINYFGRISSTILKDLETSGLLTRPEVERFGSLTWLCRNMSCGGHDKLRPEQNGSRGSGACLTQKDLSALLSI